MKKLFLLMCLCLTFTSVAQASNVPNPSLRIVLFYKVSESILQCQNSEENITEGKKELESELRNHYSKRFIVDRIERVPEPQLLSVAECFAKVKTGEVPLIIKISLEGQGSAPNYYQNGYGAQKIALAATTTVHLTESRAYARPDDTFYNYDYGPRIYSAGSFALGRDIYSSKDPRVNTKNAVRASFRDACKFNDSINKYASPKAYEDELARFTGDFKKGALENKPKNDRLAKFTTWCQADSKRSGFLLMMSNLTMEGKMAIIDELVKIGYYKEN